MQKLIAFLLHKFTPYRVIAWSGGKIAGIGVPFACGHKYEPMPVVFDPNATVQQNFTKEQYQKLIG